MKVFPKKGIQLTNLLHEHSIMQLAKLRILFPQYLANAEANYEYIISLYVRQNSNSNQSLK